MELPELQSIAPTIYFLMRTVLEFIFTCTCHKLDYVNCFNKRKTIVLKFTLRIRNGKEEILLQNLTKLVEVEKAGVQEYRRDFCHVILQLFKLNLKNLIYKILRSRTWQIEETKHEH